MHVIEAHKFQRLVIEESFTTVLSCHTLARTCHTLVPLPTMGTLVAVILAILSVQIKVFLKAKHIFQFLSLSRLQIRGPEKKTV